MVVLEGWTSVIFETNENVAEILVCLIFWVYESHYLINNCPLTDDRAISVSLEDVASDGASDGKNKLRRHQHNAGSIRNRHCAIGSSRDDVRQQRTSVREQCVRL